MSKLPQARETSIQELTALSLSPMRRSQVDALKFARRGNRAIVAARSYGSKSDHNLILILQDEKIQPRPLLDLSGATLPLRSPFTLLKPREKVTRKLADVALLPREHVHFRYCLNVRGHR